MITPDTKCSKGEHASDQAPKTDEVATIQLTISPEDRIAKPIDASRESQLLSIDHTVSITQEEFANLVTAPHARSWCGAVLRGKRISKNFQSIQVLALDFDNEAEQLARRGLNPISPEEVECRCQEEGLGISLIYTSFSDHPEQRKFRAIWILDQPITDLTLAKKALKLLMAIFPEADESCKDPVRMWYGGRARIQNIPSRLSLAQLQSVALPIIASQTSSDHIARTIKRNVIRNRADNVYPLNNYNNLEATPNSPKFDKLLEHYDWAYAAAKCTLLKKLFEAKDKILHSDLFFLASGMFCIRGGAARFKQAVLANPNIADEKVHIIEYIRSRKDSDQPIYPLSFSALPTHHPDRHLQKHFKNLLAIKPVRQYDKPRFIADHRKLLPLYEARQKLQTELTKALEAEENKIYVFKCATGIGKTQLALQQRGVAILFPNHDLKDEKSQGMQIPHLCTPRLPESLPDVVRWKFNQICKIGQHAKANDYLRAVRDGQVQLDLTDEEMEQCKTSLKLYFEALQKCFSTRYTILTTHHKGIFVDFPNHSTYIIDEDFFSQLLKEERISSYDLQKIETALRAKGAKKDADRLERLVRQFDSQLEQTLVEHIPIEFEKPELLESTILELTPKLSGNVTAFFNCSAYHVSPVDRDNPKGEKEIAFIKKVELVEGKKYIILSATANEQLYRRLFQDIEFIDISQVQQRGSVIQVSDKSFSRRAIRDNPERLEVAKKFLPNLPVISFKNMRDNIEEADEIVHFGKCEGYNHLTGHDLKIIGTPHYNVLTYLLIAKTLGIDLPPDADHFKQLLVQHNGFEFYFFTFEHEDLRAIQFYFLERELMQAIGRARLLDNDAIVVLFSDFPIPGAKQYNLNALPKLLELYSEYNQRRTRTYLQIAQED